ncbi:hypothetical protein [Rhizobium binxianense]
MAERGDQQLRDLASLARLVAYARENARELKAEVSAYCLDLALGALLRDLNESGVSLLPDEKQVDASISTLH